MSKNSEKNTNQRDVKKKHIILGLEVSIIIILLISFIGLYNSPERRLLRQLDFGQKYLATQDYEQAIVAFTKAIEIDPLNVDAYIGLAQAYEGLGEYDQARAVLEEGSEFVGENVELSSYLDEVRALIENDNVDEIINIDSRQLFPESETSETEEQALNIEEKRSEEQSEQTEEIVWTVERRDFSPVEENGEILLRIYYDLVQTDSNDEHCQEINAILEADYDAFVEQVPAIKRDNAALEYATVEEPYSATVKAEITYADEHFLSIKWTEYSFMGGVGNETYAGTVFSLDTGKKVTAQELYSLDPNAVTAYFKFEVMEYININCGGQRMIYNRMQGDFPDGYDVVVDYTFDDFSFYLKDGYPVLCFAPYLLGPGASGSFEIPCNISIFDDRNEIPNSSLIGQWVGCDHANNLIYSMTFQEDSKVEYIIGWGELIGSEIVGEIGYIYEGTYDVEDWDKEHVQGNMAINTSETFETFETYHASWKICFLGRNVIAVTNSDGSPIYRFVGADGVLIMMK